MAPLLSVHPALPSHPFDGPAPSLHLYSACATIYGTSPAAQPISISSVGPDDSFFLVFSSQSSASYSAFPYSGFFLPCSVPAMFSLSHCLGDAPLQRNSKGRPRMVLRPPPTPSLLSSSSSATSSSSLAQSTQIPSSLPSLPASLANRMEELDCSGASLNNNPGPLANYASVSHPGPLAPPNSLATQSLQDQLHDTQFHMDGLKASKNSRRQPQSRAGSNADPECEWKTCLALMQILVFDLCRDMDDLRFRLQSLDNKAYRLLQLFSTLQGAHLQAPEAAQSTTTQAATTSASVFPLENLGHADADNEDQRLPSRPEHVHKEEHLPSKTENAMQLDCTPLQEKSPPLRDMTFHAFCMAASPHYSPYR